MKADYRFVRTRGGVLGFAVVEVDSRLNDAWEVTWMADAALSAIRPVFGAAVEAGISLAAAAHEKLGGSPQLVEVRSLGYTPADTRPDAVVCAAAMAAWKSWGRDVALAAIDYENGWRISFHS